MTSYFHDRGTLNVVLFQFVDYRLTSTVVCQFLLLLMLKLCSLDNPFHHFVDAICAHGLSFVPSVVVGLVLVLKVKRAGILEWEIGNQMIKLITNFPFVMPND